MDLQDLFTRSAQMVAQKRHFAVFEHKTGFFIDKNLL